MELFLRLQNFILDASPALIPFLAILYSFFTSLHCSIMCGPFLPAVKERHTYYLFRIISYVSLGGLLGYFGEVFKQSLEYQLVSILAFLTFSGVTLTIAGLKLLPAGLSRRSLVLRKAPNGVWRGLLSAFIPCHSLLFFYALAIITQSALGGALVLFSHSVVSTPSLAYGRRLIERFILRFNHGQKLIHFFILMVALINISYFASRIFHNEEKAKTKVLFCF
jgi:sulfite exporter TauE/SafE